MIGNQIVTSGRNKSILYIQLSITQRGYFLCAS